MSESVIEPLDSRPSVLMVRKQRPKTLDNAVTNGCCHGNQRTHVGRHLTNPRKKINKIRKKLERKGGEEENGEKHENISDGENGSSQSR